MGDRTSLQMQVITDDADLRAKAREVFDEYSGSEIFQDDWHDEDLQHDNVWMVGSAESPCGNAVELAVALDDLLKEEGKDLAYVVWEDPKYEWLGDVHIHVPGLEPDFRADCDSNGMALLTHAQVADLVESAKAGHQDIGERLLLMSGAIHYAAFDALKTQVESSDNEPAGRYVATISVPGYLPMDDDPPVFMDAADAWAYLAEERQRAEDDDEDATEYSETLETLNGMATGGAQLGSVVGPTPGYTGDHDLGLVYAVREVEQ